MRNCSTDRLSNLLEIAQLVDDRMSAAQAACRPVLRTTEVPAHLGAVLGWDFGWPSACLAFVPVDFLNPVLSPPR